eukprot:3141385-Rhodomonas_salina.1
MTPKQRREWEKAQELRQQEQQQQQQRSLHRLPEERDEDLVSVAASSGPGGGGGSVARGSPNVDVDLINRLFAEGSSAASPGSPSKRSSGGRSFSAVSPSAVQAAFGEAGSSGPTANDVMKAFADAQEEGGGGRGGGARKAVEKLSDEELLR